MLYQNLMIQIGKNFRLVEAQMKSSDLKIFSNKELMLKMEWFGLEKLLM